MTSTYVTLAVLWRILSSLMAFVKEPSQIHPTPTEVLLTTAVVPLVMQLSGSPTRGCGVCALDVCNIFVEGQYSRCLLMTS
jgi:hypothetical protein